MRTARGFTLIELMIVVAVLALLSAIAFPQYTNYIQRGKITEATSSLSELRLRAEKRYADNRAYTGFSQAIDNAKYFTYACVINANDFICTATGVANQGMTGFVYTINESNTRASDFTGVAGWNDCATKWITKKGEPC